jgi:hypothetical protein
MEMFTVQEALISPFCGSLSALGLKPGNLEALFHLGMLKWNKSYPHKLVAA